MTKLIKLDKDESIQIKDKLQEYLTPDFVYVPFPPKKEDLKKELNIKKGSLLYQDVYSPISGTLKKVEKKFLATGKEVNCLVFSNDFQEKREKTTATRKKINNLTKQEIVEGIYNTKLQKKLLKEHISIFLISGIDDEPYIENEAFIQREYTKSIVDTIDALLNAYPNSKAYIALKNTDSKTILAYQNVLGMYKNVEIKLVEDLFLIGKEAFLAKYLHLKDYVYLTTSTLYEIYLNLKKRMPFIEKMITISGNGICHPFVIKTKLGVSVLDIFKKFYPEDLANCVFYVNGIMQGTIINLNKLIVTRDLDGIIIMVKERRNAKKCIKCGKCISICPIHSNPLLAYKLGMQVKCIQCGLCSYICPSYIPLYKYLNGDKDE